MLIIDDNNRALILEDIHAPTVDNFWVLDLQMMDYTLAQLMILEEIIAPTIVVRIGGFDFPLPSNWNILVVDADTQQLDVVEIKDVAGKEFRAMVFGPNKSRHENAIISVIDYFPNCHNIAPTLFKHQMLCHPIDKDVWINVAPSDGYNKYLKHAVAGDVI